MSLSKLIWLIVGFYSQLAFTQTKSLGFYKVDPQSITISGVSSGAFMTVQMQVAFSQLIQGSAAIAGGPFWCAEGDVQKAQGQCMATPENIRSEVQIQEARRLAALGEIDNLSFLASRKLMVFASSRDLKVKKGSSDKLVEFYSAFTAPQNILYVQDQVAGHGVPTLDYGAPCGIGMTPYLLKCQRDLAGEILKAMYGPLKERTIAIRQNLLAFDQKPFGNADTPLFASGWIYVPTECAQGQTCKLHIALHGCKMNPDFIQDQFARQAGYNEWAEANRIIVLYPQSAKLTGNPYGCWDWFGFSTKNYVHQKAPQMNALRSMIRQISGL